MCHVLRWVRLKRELRLEGIGKAEDIEAGQGERINGCRDGVVGDIDCDHMTGGNITQDPFRFVAIGAIIDCPRWRVGAVLEKRWSSTDL
ncbi:hypothetical protein ACLOJK_019379 [Asimina triloba]